MALFPNYIPFTEDTNYEEVLITTKEMFSWLDYNGCCNNKVKCQDMLRVDSILASVSEDQANNEPRYKLDIQSAYRLLYNLI